MAGKVNIVMQYGGVQGTSGLSEYKQWIVVRSMQFGGEWQDFARDGTGVKRVSGTLALQYVRISRSIDVSTHGLYQAFVTKQFSGQPVTIKLVSGDGGKDTLLSCVLQNPSILHWQRAMGQQGSGGEVMVLAAKEVTVTGIGYGVEGNQESNQPVVYNYEEMKVQ